MFQYFENKDIVNQKIDNELTRKRRYAYLNPPAKKAISPFEVAVRLPLGMEKFVVVHSSVSTL
jgi:hypothetical protein